MPFSPFTIQSPEKAFEQLKSSKSGLQAPEARARMGEYGPNELKTYQLRWEKILLRQFTSPFLYLLAAAGITSLLLGEFIDAAIIVAFVSLNTGLGFFQEYQSEKAVALLRTFVVSRTRVRRDNQIETIDSRELVPGDLLYIETGDHIPADIRFLETEGLVVDESILTGESKSVGKNEDTLKSATKEPYEAHNIGFAGTSVVSGRGMGIVIATGSHTQIGEISHLADSANEASTFEKGIRQFSRFILWIIVITLALVFITNLIVKGGNVNIPELFIFSIVLAVSVIPEALPVVTTMTLSRGALRLAKHGVVIKRLSAVEDLGSIEVLCTDKTGTLTENHLTVANVYGEKLATIESAMLGISSFDEKSQLPTNPFDLAIWEASAPANRLDMALAPHTHEVPFSPQTKQNSAVVTWKRAHHFIVRGAPEELAKLCHLSKEETDKLTAWTHEEGLKGCRVLAIGTCRVAATSKPTTENTKLTFLGAISFLDTVKRTSKGAVAHAKKLGVSIKILTGDSAGVAGAVGFAIGLIETPDQVLTGPEWAAMSHEEHQAAVEKFSVFARISPQEKYEIIQTLQQTYEVGFLGEGINDAPALKIANVGIVVDSASTIAREAADVILLKHNLGVIISGIREGREVFTNTTKYIKTTLASNFGNFFAIASAMFLIDYLPMLSVQILLVNLLSDLPMILIATDTVDPETLRRPHSYQVQKLISIAIVIGIVSTMFDFTFFSVFRHGGPAVLQTNWFIGSVLTELALIFSIRTRKPFWKAKMPATGLLLLSAIAFASAIIIPYTTIGHTVFQFISPTGIQLAMVLGIVTAYFITTETVKLLFYKINARSTQ